MDQRLDSIYDLLVEVLGSENVYYHPDENTKMVYDAIVYHLSDLNTQHAGDLPYKINQVYTVTLITRDPTNPIVHKLARLRTSRFDRTFPQDGLYHTVFTITY